MKREEAAILIFALLWPGALLAQKPPSLKEQLEAQYQQPGTVLTIKQAGILGVPATSKTPCVTKYEGGKLTAAASCTASKPLTRGEKVNLLKIEVDEAKGKISFRIGECDACNNGEFSSRTSQIDFHFANLRKASVPEIEDTISEVLALDAVAEPQPQQAQGSQEQAGEQTAGVLGNNDIVKMAKVHLGDEIIISTIKSSQCNFDTSVDGMVKLKTAGVSDAVIQAMRDAKPPDEPVTGGPDVACGDYESCLKGGNDAFQGSQWDQALAYFQKASSLRPTEPDVRVRIGRTYLALGQYSEVPAAWDKALSLRGQVTFSVCHEHGFALCKVGDFSLGAEQVSFATGGGQKLFSVAASEIGLGGTFDRTGSGNAYFRLSVKGKNYNFDFLPFGVTCKSSTLVTCPQQGFEQQSAVVSYVSQTIPKLASGQFAKQ